MEKERVKVKSRSPCKDYITSVVITSNTTDPKLQRKIDVISKRCSKVTTKKGDEQIQIFFTDGTSLQISRKTEKRCKDNKSFKTFLGCKGFEELINYFVICFWN